MKPNQIQTYSSFTEILTRSSTLQDFVKKAESLLQINRYVLSKLDPILAAQCQVTALQDNILILTTHSATFGHQLRFMSPELLSILRQNPKWSALKAIQIKVRPTVEMDESPTLSLKKHPVSHQSANHIQAMAQEISAPKLRQSLLRFCKRYL